MNSTRRGFLATVGAVAVAGCGAPRAGEGRTGSGAYREAYEAVSSSVVRIRTASPAGSGQGSGFLYDGHVVTNEHVVFGATTVRVQFADGEWNEIERVGTDPFSDLAALTAAGRGGGTAGLSLAERTPSIGTEVMAIGSPFGLQGTATTGIVSGRNRSFPGPDGFPIADMVQTDAAVNPGNSGGPLVTLAGEVVGVVTAGGGDNVGFAVSSPLARRVLPELIATGEYRHSFLGVSVLPVTPEVAEANDLPEVGGVYVQNVLATGPGAGVLSGSTGETTVDGIRVPTGGDVILALDGEPIRTTEEFSRYLALETTPGDELALTVRADGGVEDRTVTLDERPSPR